MPPLLPPPSFTQQIVMNRPRNLRHCAKHCLYQWFLWNGISGFRLGVPQEHQDGEVRHKRVELNEVSVMYEDPPCTRTGCHPPAQGSVLTLMLQFIKRHYLHRPHVSSSEAQVRRCLHNSAQLCGFPAAVMEPGAGGPTL